MEERKTMEKMEPELRPLEMLAFGWTCPSNDLIMAQFDKKLTRSAMAVLHCLLVHCNRKDGKCFPSAQTLARETGMNECSVFRAVNELKEKNFIKVISGGFRDGRNLANTYFINDPNFHYWAFEQPVRSSSRPTQSEAYESQLDAPAERDSPQGY
jgi:hypothetical protein